MEGTPFHRDLTPEVARGAALNLLNGRLIGDTDVEVLALTPMPLPDTETTGQ